MGDQKNGWSLRLNQVMAARGIGSTGLARLMIEQGCETGQEPLANRIHKFKGGAVAQPRNNEFRLIATALGVSEMWLRDGVTVDESQTKPDAPTLLSLYERALQKIAKGHPDPAELAAAALTLKDVFEE